MRKKKITIIMSLILCGSCFAQTSIEDQYLRGTVQVQTGSYREALETFQSLVDEYPLPRFHLGLAQAYCGLGKIGLARKEFQIALNMDPPPEVRKRIEDYMKSVGALAQTDFEVSAGFMSDGNLTGGGNGRIDIGGLTFQLNEEAQKQSDNAFMYGTSITHSSPFGENASRWETNFSFDSTDYTEWEKFNFQSIRFSSGPSWRIGKTRLSFQGVADYSWLGYDRYGGGLGATQTFGRTLGQKAHLQGFFSYSRRNNWYAEGRTGDQIGTGVAIRRTLTKKMVVDLGYQFWRMNANEDTLASDTHLVHYGLSRLLTKTLSARFSQVFSWSHYDSGLAIFGNEPRDDTRTITSIELRKRMNDAGSNLSFEYRITDNRSNLELYDYDRGQFVTQLRILF